MTVALDTKSQRRDTWLVILAAAMVSPVGFLAGNIDRSPDLGKVFVAVGALTVIGLFTLGVIRLKAPSVGGVEVAIGIVVFSSFGLARRWLPGADGWMFLAVGLLCSVLAGLIVSLIGRRASWVVAAIRWGVYVMAAVPVVLLLSGTPALASGRGDRPVIVVFVDGYAAPSVVSEWGLGREPELFEELGSRGFAIQEVDVSYSMTYASIASALEGALIVDGGESVDGNLRRRLYRTMQGDNSFVSRIHEEGYTYWHVESGWTGTRCGEAVDQCIEAPFLEETLWNLLQRSSLAVLMEEFYGHAFTIGGNASLDWLRGAEPPDEKTLVISHVLLPHPPLYLNEECEVEYSRRATGQSVWSPYMGEEMRNERLHRYRVQMGCVDRALLEFVDNPAFDDAVVAIIGDHGSDSLGQLRTDVDDWTASMVEERMTTIGAVRGCEGRLPGETVNILPYVLECAIGVPAHRVPLEQFLVPVEELAPGAQVVSYG